MLVDPTTGQLTAVSQSAVLANEASEEVGHELFLQQIETSTPPCERAEDLLDGLRAGRRAVGEAAAAAGARAVAMATPVLAEQDEDFTPTSRYRRIQSEYGEMARQSLVCAMHMHVDVASDAEAVRVVDGIRPWLPLLVALGANSPFWQGRDTGHAELALAGVEPLAHRRPGAGVRRRRDLPRGLRADDRLGRRARRRDAVLRRPARRGLPDRRDPGRRRLHRRRGRPARRPAGPRAGQHRRRRPHPADLARRPAPGGRLAGRPARPRRRSRAPHRGAARAGPGGVRRHRGALPRRPGRQPGPRPGHRVLRAAGGRRHRCDAAAPGTRVGGSLRAVVEDLARRTEESWA